MRSARPGKKGDHDQTEDTSIRHGDTLPLRVSEALALGYVLYGSPAATFDGKTVIVAQALVWPAAVTTSDRSDP